MNLNLRILAWIRNDLSVTMTDAFASDASVWNARVTCYVVLENVIEPSNFIKFLAPLVNFGAPSKKSAGGPWPPGPPARPPLGGYLSTFHGTGTCHFLGNSFKSLRNYCYHFHNL